MPRNPTDKEVLQTTVLPSTHLAANLPYFPTTFSISKEKLMTDTCVSMHTIVCRYMSGSVKNLIQFKG